MRITCPNCQAQYDIDPSMIPEAGRDVQCSSCAHTWFQTRMEDIPDEIEAAAPDSFGASAMTEREVEEAQAKNEAEAPSEDGENVDEAAPERDTEDAQAASADSSEVDDTEDEPEPPRHAAEEESAQDVAPDEGGDGTDEDIAAAGNDDHADETDPDDRFRAAMENARQDATETAEEAGEDLRETLREAVSDTGAEDAPAEDPGPELDRDVAEILREEAAFETTKRRDEDAPPAIEPQGDLDLDEGRRPSQVLRDRLERMRGEGEPQPDAVASTAAAAATTATMAHETSRRDRLPDIEGINSSLRPGDSVPDDEPPIPPVELLRTRRAGFRTGFAGMIALVALLIGVYVYAPQIARLVPATEPALISYVGAANTARDRIDGMMARAISGIERAAGTGNGA